MKRIMAFPNALLILHAAWHAPRSMGGKAYLDDSVGCGDADPIGGVAALLAWVGSNRTTQPPRFKAAPEALDALDRLGLTWADAMALPWPLFRILDRLQVSWFFYRCPGKAFAQWSNTMPPYMICVEGQPGTAIGAPMLSVHMQNRGYWTECVHMQRWLPKAGPACKLVVDVGASTGVCTLLFAALGFEVIAIDGNPRHIHLLSASVKLNGYEQQVRVVHSAVADVVGQGQMLLPRDGALSTLEFHEPGVLHRLRSADHANTRRFFSRGDFVGDDDDVDQVRSLPVRVTTVDTQVRDRIVCFLKSDVEASDHLVYWGAHRTLLSARLISFEMNSHISYVDSNFSRQEQLNFIQGLRSKGFELRRLSAKPGSVADDEFLLQASGVFVGYRREQWPWSLPPEA